MSDGNPRQGWLKASIQIRVFSVRPRKGSEHRFALKQPGDRQDVPHTVTTTATNIESDRRRIRASGGVRGTESAGISRHIVGDERALRKRRSESIPASSLACDLARDGSEA